VSTDVLRGREWTTALAPSASGCCSMGVAKVLSTTAVTPVSRAARSIRRQVGDAEQRIGRGLEPQQVGAVHRVEHLLGIHHVDGARTQSSLFLQTFEETRVRCSRW